MRVLSSCCDTGKQSQLRTRLVQVCSSSFRLGSKSGWSLTINPFGKIDAPPKNSKVKLCLVVVSFVRWVRIQNFRNVWPFLLIDFSFMVGRWWGWGGMVCIFMSNPTSVEVKLRLRRRKVYSNIVKILCKYCTDIVKFLKEYFTDIVQILYEYYLKIVQILYHFCANIVQNVERILFKYC